MPTLAEACSRIFEPPKPLRIAQSDLRFGFPERSTRADWGVAEGWVSTRPRFAQLVRPEGWDEDAAVNASFRQQRTLMFSAAWPEGGKRATDDTDPATPPCAIAGQYLSSRPTFLVRETANTVRIIAISRPNGGDRTGCTTVSTSCDGERTVTFRLKQPVGDRRILRSAFV